MTNENTAFIVYDIETIPNGKLIADVLYPGEAVSPEEAIARQEEEMLKATANRSSFVPQTFQYPVAIAVARIGADFKIQKTAILDEPHYRTETMVELFWKGLAAYPDACLVDFGGRHFDLPVLEFSAYKYGISVPHYFNDQHSRNYRHRWSSQHLDLLEWFTNWGAFRLNGGLNLMAKMLGKPGKMDIKGEAVYELWRNGEKQKVGSYCLCDVLDTYFVFLRSRRMQGLLSAEEEAAAEEHAHAVIEDIAFENEYVEAYLNRMKRTEEPDEPEDELEPPA